MSYKQDFIDRVRRAREMSGLTQAQIASSLGYDRDKYKQYELRSLLPHEKICEFCKITKIRTDWLLGENVPMDISGNEWIDTQVNWLEELNDDGRQAYEDLKSLHEKYLKREK